MESVIKGEIPRRDWDGYFKDLVAYAPEAFATLVTTFSGLPILEGAEEVRVANITDEQIKSLEVLGFQSTEFRRQKLLADVLLNVNVHGKEILINLEFQNEFDGDMPERLLDYCLRAQKVHKKPVISCVVYPLKIADVQHPPLKWNMPNGQTYMAFQYGMIELDKLTAEQLQDLRQPGLLPLLVLTNGGKDRTIVEKALTDLWEAECFDLLPITQVFASYVLEPLDQEWLLRRYKELSHYHSLEETPIYQAMQKDAIQYGLKKGLEQGLEQGKKQGLEQGKKQGLEEGEKKGLEKGIELGEKHGLADGFRSSLARVISLRFPTLAQTAPEQISHIHSVDELNALLEKVILAQDSDEVERLLTEVQAQSQF